MMSTGTPSNSSNVEKGCARSSVNKKINITALGVLTTSHGADQTHIENHGVPRHDFQNFFPMDM